MAETPVYRPVLSKIGGDSGANILDPIYPYINLIHSNYHWFFAPIFYCAFFQLALIVEMLGVPEARLLEGAKRGRNFFSSKGYPRYCQVVQVLGGTTMLMGGRSKRGEILIDSFNKQTKNKLGTKK